MPTLKYERVVSFSSEDPNFPAKNLLEGESVKKWKCKSAGEEQAVVILQLESPSQIIGVDIGNEGSGLVEVLVGRQSSDEFKVLLVSSSFMSPGESKLGECKNRVRIFGKDKLCEGVVDEKWDRIKVVCRQPFNRHVQYGLCFVRLHSPEPPRLGKFELKVKNNDADPFKAGYLFGKRKELVQDEEPLKGAAAIRAASRPEALQQQEPPKKNKVLVELQQKKDTASSSSSQNTIDPNTPPPPKKKRSPSPQPTNSSDKPKKVNSVDSPTVNKPKKPKVVNANTPRVRDDDSNSSSSTDTSRRLRPSDHTVRNSTSPPPKQKWIRKKQKLRKPFNKLLEGVVFVISGYQNPERSNLRRMALEMGAKYKADWDWQCTHLVCAFRNTPKFLQVQGTGKIVCKEWIQQCYAQRVRLPWRRHALDKRDQNEEESEDEIKELVAVKNEPTSSSMQENESNHQRVKVKKEHTSPSMQEDESDYVPVKVKKEEDDPGSGYDTEEEIEKVQRQSRYNPAFDSDTEVDEPDSSLDSGSELDFPSLPKCSKSTFKDGSKFYVPKILSASKWHAVMKAIYHHNGIPVRTEAMHCDYILSDKPPEEHQEELKRWPQAKIIPLYGLFLERKKKVKKVFVPSQ